MKSNSNHFILFFILIFPLISFASKYKMGSEMRVDAVSQDKEYNKSGLPSNSTIRAEVLSIYWTGPTPIKDQSFFIQFTADSATQNTNTGVGNFFEYIYLEQGLPHDFTLIVGKQNIFAGSHEKETAGSDVFRRPCALQTHSRYSAVRGRSKTLSVPDVANTTHYERAPFARLQSNPSRQ